MFPISLRRYGGSSRLEAKGRLELKVHKGLRGCKVPLGFPAPQVRQAPLDRKDLKDFKDQRALSG